MFAMLNGRWPGTPVGEADEPAVDARVREAVAAQEAAGLDVVTDGQLRWTDPWTRVPRALAEGDTGDEGLLVRAWQATSALTNRHVAQVVPGPYTMGRRGDQTPVVVTPAGTIPPATVAPAADREARTLELADALAGELRALADAGCPMTVVEEPAAVSVGIDPAERSLFVAAQQRLLALVPGLHAMLAITGGSANDTGAETIAAAPYRSFLLDLVAGPDSWYLARALPGERGIVCAAFDPAPRDGRDPGDPTPLLIWAARYAASMRGRGLDRVGLANAGSLADLSPEEATAQLARLARAARLAVMSPRQAVAAGLDPRTFSRSLARPGQPRPPRGRPPTTRRTPS
jgi:hypothetical protein